MSLVTVNQNGLETIATHSNSLLPRKNAVNVRSLVNFWSPPLGLGPKVITVGSNWVEARVAGCTWAQTKRLGEHPRLQPHVVKNFMFRDLRCVFSISSPQILEDCWGRLVLLGHWEPCRSVPSR